MNDTRAPLRLLTSLALADAYGAGFEFVAPEIVAKENTGKRFRDNGNLLAGRYTDDTQMSLALAEAVLCGEPWTPRYLAERFVSVYHRDPRPGYAQGFASVLATCRNGSDFLAKIRPDSTRNGAAMRAVPLGFLPTVGRVKRAAELQATLTHNTPSGIVSAQAAALLSHYAIYARGPVAEVGVFLEREVPGVAWNSPWVGPVPLDGIGTVRAAVTAVKTHTDLTDLLIACVAFTGDTDSVATIAVGAAAGSAAYRQNLPQTLYRTVENGAFGRDYLKSLDSALTALRPAPQNGAASTLG